jgi:hypothetical protein
VELFIRLSIDTPCRVGIKFTYEYLAVREYEEIVRKHRGETFLMKLEPVSGKIDLHLVSEQTGIRLKYKALECNLKEIHKLSSGAIFPMQFVHLFPKANSLYIAKPFRKEEFVTVTSCEIISTGNFSDVV